MFHLTEVQHGETVKMFNILIHGYCHLCPKNRPLLTNNVIGYQPKVLMVNGYQNVVMVTKMTTCIPN